MLLLSPSLDPRVKDICNLHDLIYCAFCPAKETKILCFHRPLEGRMDDLLCFHRPLEGRMDDLVTEMEELLEIEISDEGEEELQHPARRYFRETKAMFRTTADILEAPDCYIFVLDMPGLEANNIKAKVENNILHIAGKKKKNKPLNPEVKVIRMERRRARYMRKFSLPGDSNLEDIKASYKDGVLTVTVAKRQPSEAGKPKSVTIPIS